MRSFIIRPFGEKNGINFDVIERDLIAPALKAAGFTGGTTIDILRAGNIRTDMFQRLLTADLVVAELSIHNANVFYELGIRHALRDKRTFMLRANLDKFPFDLQTDRYFAYDHTRLADSLPLLTEALRQTKASEVQDSPVFKALPRLAAQDRSHFLAVPPDFREEVERAVADKQVGDLELLGSEVHGFEWESEGLRVVGRALFDLKAFDGARVMWEAVRKLDQLDLQANLLLGTIYERLGDLTRSMQALNRALNREGVDRSSRAEAYALLGRNAKTLWKKDWRQAPSDKRRQQALRSPHLDESLKAYAEAFDEDLNHYYSGLNACAMLNIQVELAQAHPETWAERFEDEHEAERELSSRKLRLEKLLAAVELSLEATLKQLEREQKTDIWARISEADLCSLISKRPSRVASTYASALAGAPEFAADSVRGQLELYAELKILEGNVKAALEVVPASRKSEGPAKTGRVLLFTGHVIDAPGREHPRFPPDKEGAARQRIRQAIEGELRLAGGIDYGIAGGASGGDILFHEACEELGIPTRLYLALPREQFIEESVQPAGPQWVERFNQLYRKLPRRELGESTELPRWLREKPDYGIWQRNNLWELHNALAAGSTNVTLIALWNGKKGDGPGGTEDMVKVAEARGAKTLIIDTNTL
jgi:tetratricopeptide (TPR) repeat protein